MRKEAPGDLPYEIATAFMERYESVSGVPYMDAGYRADRFRETLECGIEALAKVMVCLVYWYEETKHEKRLEAMKTFLEPFRDRIAEWILAGGGS